MMINQYKKEGISLRTIHLLLIIGAVLISVLMLFSTYQLTRSFESLTQASEQQIELRKAARELMDASDYLTEKVQRFSVMGDSRFLDEYFEEALVANHREEAIRRMSQGSEKSEALDDLKKAMEGSLELMNREYYAMRLVIDAQGIKEYAEVLDAVELTDEDSIKKINIILDRLDEDEDVQKVYHNWDE